MVAHKVVNRNARIGNFGQLPQSTGKTLGHYRFIFEPKIEKIPKEKNSGSIFFNAIQPGHKLFFPWKTEVPGRGPQMIVTGEVYFFARGNVYSFHAGPI